MNDIKLALNVGINRLLMFFGLRSMPKFWGVVYDSVSKQPIDPALVKLIDVNTGKVVGSCVTDLFGQYGFLIYPGRFKILVQRTNYHFPSVLQKGDSDRSYDKLYHGEFFDVTGDVDVIALNIPLDPLRPDWNQQAKKTVTKAIPRMEKIRPIFFGAIFWIGFILTGVLYYSHHHFYLLFLLGAFALVIILALVTPELRMWGKIEPEPNEGELLVQLSHPQLPEIVISKSLVGGDGKFYIRVPKGEYMMQVVRKSLQGSQIIIQKKIKVGNEGIVNKIIRIKSEPVV